MGVSKNWSNFAPTCRSLEITTQKTHTQKRRLPCSRVLYGDVGFGSINMSMKVWFIDPESHIESPKHPNHVLRFSPKTSYCLILEKNVNMNHNEEVPDFLGGLGDMLPADVLKKVNELLRAQSLMEPREKGLRITYQPMTINVFVRNDFSGEMKDIHVAHADVAVGVAEKGSNVCHHKTDSHE